MTGNNQLELDSACLQKGVGALRAFYTQTDKSLVGDDSVSLIITTRFVPAKPSKKPHTVELPHSLNSAPKTCIFVRDPQSTAKETLAKKGMSFSKVLSLQKCKTKYATYEQKRALCNEFDLFFSDDVLTPMLSKTLGKSFFKTKKQPISVKFDKLDANKLERLLASTTFVVSGGTCINITVGSFAINTDKQIAENIQAVIQPVINKLCDPPTMKQLHGNCIAIIQALAVKTCESIPIPIYTSILNSKEFGRTLTSTIDRKKAVSKVVKGTLDESPVTTSDETDEVITPTSSTTTNKRRKQPLNEQKVKRANKGKGVKAP